MNFKSDEEIKQEVERYRKAIKAKTLCERCLTANAPKSNYCMECGRPL
jgi:hypothetical protein